MVDIYILSIDGSVKDYAHFFFAVLIPFIIYLSNNIEKEINFQTNLGNMINKLNDIFPNIKITNNYTIEKSLIRFNYDLYKEIKTNNKNQIILLEAFDIFNQKYFENVNLSCLEKMLKEKYFILNRKYEKIKKYTTKYIKIKNYQPIIHNYFENILITKKLKLQNKKIILIKRKRPKIFESNFNNAHSGQRRFIYNFKKLKAALKEYFGNDLIVLNLDNMHLLHQYFYFSNAQLVIAQHGAGLCNIYFMKKNTNVLEITPFYDNYWFRNLSDCCNLNYYNVEQSMMTYKQAYKFFSSIYTDIDANFLNKIKSICNNKIHHDMFWLKSMEEILIENSGNVNINKVLSIIKNIRI